MPRIRNRSTKDFTTNKKEELGPRTKSLRNWKRVWFLAVHVEHRRSKLNKLSCNQLLLWFSCCFYSINVINYISDTSFCLQEPRENEGTERDIQGVGWDMSIPLKLFLVLGGNGSLFPQTSA